MHNRKGTPPRAHSCIYQYICYPNLKNTIGLQSELKSQLLKAESVGHDALETIKVEVKESEICVEAEWLEESDNVSMVDVNACNHFEGGIGRRWGRIDNRVGADAQAIPAGYEVEWV